MKFKVDNYRYTPNTIEEIANNYAFMYSKSFSLIEKKSKRKLTEKQKLEGYLKVTSKLPPVDTKITAPAKITTTYKSSKNLVVSLVDVNGKFFWQLY